MNLKTNDIAVSTQKTGLELNTISGHWISWETAEKLHAFLGKALAERSLHNFPLTEDER